jgi:predicted AlkP superfamily phosphohydrolase/phosphomutase
MSRVLLLGLDCLSPELVFERWADELPNLAALMRQGTYGKLRSCIPPITVPAWSCMLSSKDPGQLGIYGFRNRRDYSYTGLQVVTSRDVPEDRVWDILSRAGRSSVLIGVPGTYPPPAIQGDVIADFLTPDKSAQFTYPPALKDEVQQVAPNYSFDVAHFRTPDKQSILDQIYGMTTERFRVARHLMETRDWDFFMLHEIGPDRIHHGFWSAMDPAHRNYVAGNPYENCILDYYRHMDREIGTLLEALPAGAHVIVASDHGAKCMRGGVRINEFLRQRGYLTLTSEPAQPLPLSQAGVDWSKTLAWGEGGYYARIFFNVRGREPEGALAPADCAGFAETLAAELTALPDDQGAPMATRAYRPSELYRATRGIPPDLTVFFDDLAWRSVGTVGGGEVYSFENDTGPDDANHAMDGLAIVAPANGYSPRPLEDATLYDVAPTILELLGMAVPGDMIGRTLVDSTAKAAAVEGG